MKLGCHAVLFGEKIKSDTEALLKDLASTGFQGTEIGSRFFGTKDKALLESLLEKYKIELTGMHIGGGAKAFLEKEEETAGKILEVAEFVRTMPNKNVIMSGGKLEGVDLEAASVIMEKTAKKCLDMGVRLHYHNHDWEFINGDSAYEIFAQYAPSMHYALDLGWVHAAGLSPVSIVKKFADNVSYVHLRDVKGPGKEFTDLGKGTFDYPELMNTLKAVLGKDGWAVVEYEEGEKEIGRYTQAKSFLAGLL